MKKKDKNLEQLKTLLDTNYDDALEGRTDKEERFRKSYLYYMCLAPEKSQNEISAYVEPIVRKAVEAIKPSLMNIFTENEKKAVTFRPSALVTPEIASLVDDKINNVFLRDNDGYSTIERAVTEALVTGDVFLKYYLDEKVITDEMEFEGAPVSMLEACLTEYPDTDLEKLPEVLKTKDDMVTGTVTLIRNERTVKVEFVPFQDIIIGGNTEDIADSRYLCHRIRKTVSEMKALGFDEYKIDEAGTASDDTTSLSMKSLVNDGAFTSEGESASSSVVADPEEREVFLFEHYIHTSLVDGKNSGLYRIYSTDKDILECELVDCIPFVHGVVERIPGSFWGISFYDKHGPAQDVASKHIRTKEAKALFDTYGRYQAVKGAYDRQSLLSNRPGGIIEVSSPQAVTPFQVSSSTGEGDSIFQHVLSSTREDVMSAVGVDVTGANMSATAAAITANSADMKDKVIARVLAYTLFRPLFKGIYNILRNEDMVIGELPNPQFAEAEAMAQEAMAQGMDVSELAQIPPTIVIGGSQLPLISDFQIDVNTASDDSVLANQLIQLVTLKAQMGPAISEDSFAKIAEKITGLSAQEILVYFPVAQPSPEEQAMQQQQMQEQMEVAELQKDLLRAQVGESAARTAYEEQRTLEMIKDGDAKRQRDEEKSIQEFKRLEMMETELALEAGGTKVSVGRYK